LDKWNNKSTDFLRILQVIQKGNSLIERDGYLKSQFGSITVFGKKQLTCKEWPFYYFGQDDATRGNHK
jgi:hypothetical protein